MVDAGNNDGSRCNNRFVVISHRSCFCYALDKEIVSKSARYAFSGFNVCLCACVCVPVLMAYASIEMI